MIYIKVMLILLNLLELLRVNSKKMLKNFNEQIRHHHYDRNHPDYRVLVWCRQI